MNKPVHFFDPVLEGLFTQRLTEHGAIAWENNTTVLFYQLNQPGQEHILIPQAYGFIRHQLQQVQQTHAADIIQHYNADALSSLQATKIKPLAKQFCTQENLHQWLEQTAAILLTQPHWLQHISPAASSQTISSVQLTALYLQITQKDQQGIKLQHSYRAMLLATGIRIPSLHHQNFNQPPKLIPGILDFATLQLALSRFPRVMFPEILGFTLAFCQMPTIIEACFPEYLIPSNFFQQRQYRLKRLIPSLLHCITSYLDLFPQQTQLLWQRIQQGSWLYQLQMQRCAEQFSETLNLSTSVQHSVAKILQQKAVAAIGHYQKIQLQGISLDQWFSGLPENTSAFLLALISSGYVDRQTPANSRLLKLFDFKGPMFGVLNKPEQGSLLHWLENELKRDSTTIKDTIRADFKYEKTSHQTALIEDSNKLVSFKEAPNYAKLSNKELYYYLLNVDLFADVLPVAKTKVHKLLRACTFFNPLPFKHYSHQQLDAFIGDIYQREVDSYQPLRGTPKISKAAYIWGFEQIAPLILIDGCWIQNSLALQNTNSEICDILFSIYSDEIGNGQQRQNHPFIFQQLLDSLSIQVPPAYSKEFIEHPGFINSAFDLPVYMLSLSSFSVEFLPELLGLNMAIELSGLGKSYMRLVDDWHYWGIDPRIASIHISIDNYASGHTFLAKKAIQIYMDDIMQNTSNRITLDSHWRRIYSGYASLRFVGGRFKFGLPVEYLIHKFKCKHGFG